MGKRFILRIPRKPLLKRMTYLIPSTYERAYQNAGITNRDEQVMLFHCTQFGGFRIKKVPKDMHFEKEFVDEWFKSEYEGGYQHFRANTNFLLKFGGLETRPLEKNWLNHVLDPKEMAEHGFSSSEIDNSRKFLSELNNFYSSMRLDIEIPNSGITAKDRVQLASFHGIPYLVKKPKAGGRFFHPETSYQRVNSLLRQMMTINGKKTSEIDLIAATLQFLDIALEKYVSRSLKKTVLAYEDPYQYFLSTLNSDNFMFQYRERPIERDDVKILIYTMVYSPNGDRRKNVNRKLRRMCRNYKHGALMDSFPEFFDAIHKLESKKKVPLHMLIYREESEYAQRVLERGCLEEKLPILPLHDSFITTVPNTNRLKKVLDRTSESLYGRPLLYKQKY